MSNTNPTTVVNVFACKSNPTDLNEPHVAAVAPEALDMTHFQGAQVITWQLKTEGYVFASPPIKFHDCAGNVFSSPLVSPDQRTVSVLSQNNDGLAYSYRVFVQEVATGRISSVDPLVQNEGK